MTDKNRLAEIRDLVTEGIKEEANRMLEESRYKEALEKRVVVFEEIHYPTVLLHSVEVRIRGSRVRKGPGKGSIRLTWFPTDIPVMDDRNERMVVEVRKGGV